MCHQNSYLPPIKLRLFIPTDIMPRDKSYESSDNTHNLNFFFLTMYMQIVNSIPLYMYYYITLFIGENSREPHKK
jgi:hypothetical protein